jgi:signal transduction histidine kinase
MNFLRRPKRKGKTRHSAEDDMAAWVGALAHEIKNPLNTMKLNLQLLQEDWNQPEESNRAKVSKRLQTLGKEVDRLEEILNDFLRLARLPQPDLQPSNISSLLDEFLDFIEPETQQLHIKVVRDFHENLPQVDLDSSQIKQALLNIILNANQSMSAGGQLTVKAYRTDDHMSIDIIDTGEGMPPDRIGKLFDLFYSTKKEGTGLGLPIAGRIVNMHGGEIRVKSQEGKGTTFSILLPLHE